MEIKSARFIISLPAYGEFPGKGLPQIAVAGRSNVGKSSLINGLVRQKSLAKTSSTPGKTRLINIFLINEAFHLVDLPGYGYAKVSKAEKRAWGQMMDRYFSQAEELRLVLHLVDQRHPPSEEDKQMNAFLYGNGIPFALITTKADKLSKAQQGSMLPVIARDMAVQPFDIIQTSSKTNQGRIQLLDRMQQAIEEREEI